MPSRTASSALVAGAKRCTTASVMEVAPRLGSTTQTTCCFSTTASRPKTTKLRQKMYQWYDQDRGGAGFKAAAEEPKYLGALPNQPFPMNPLFQSQPVLDESMRTEIYKRVVTQKVPPKSVSAELGIDTRRVAAVVRMKQIELQWEKENKPMAKPYSNAILKMLPKTTYSPGRQEPHEPVNDLHVHKLTMQQLFVPVSESREFTREDAAKAFHRDLLSPDKRSPHKELITLQKAGMRGADQKTALKKFHASIQAEQDHIEQSQEKQRRIEEQKLQRVDTGRFEYRFKDVNVEVVGKNGRGRNAIGRRYGAPLPDRKKGQVKIPTSVP